MPDTASVERTNAEIRAGLARIQKSQKELGVALGLSQPSINDRLAGRIDWRLPELYRAADFLGVPVSTLVDDPEAVAS